MNYSTIYSESPVNDWRALYISFLCTEGTISFSSKVLKIVGYKVPKGSPLLFVQLFNPTLPDQL